MYTHFVAHVLVTLFYAELRRTRHSAINAILHQTTLQVLMCLLSVITFTKDRNRKHGIFVFVLVRNKVDQKLTMNFRTAISICYYKGTR